jgi:hypothetical protein
MLSGLTLRIAGPFRHVCFAVTPRRCTTTTVAPQLEVQLEVPKLKTP